MISVTSLNANGLASAKRADNFLSILHDKDVGLSSPDILLLQETHLKLPSSNSSFLDLKLFGSSYSVFHAHATSTDSHAGVAIAVRVSPSLSRPRLIAADDSGRWIHIQVHIKNIGSVSLLSVYAPASVSPTERANFFDSLPLSQLSVLSIVGGDWNCVTRPADWQTTDSATGEVRDSTNKANSVDATALSLRLQSRHLTDAEITRPHGEFSHSSSSVDTHTKSRLDRLYLSAPLSPSLTRHSLLPQICSLSDHRPLSISLSIDRTPIAKPRWTLDPAILRTPATRLELDFIASSALANFSDNTDLDAWYSALNRDTYAVCHNAGQLLHAKRIASVTKAREALSSFISDLNNRKAQNDQLATLVKLKEDLRSAEESHFGAKAHHRFIHLLRTGESSNRTFFARFKPPPKRVPMASLASAASTSRRDTLEAVEKYYKHLHRPPTTADEDAEFFLSKIVPRVSLETAQALDTPLTIEELTQAAKKLQSGKATGLDGFSPDLYQRIPALLRSVLLVWTKSIERGFLPREFRTAAVSLIYKKGPADSLDNYRPISVLPTAYKIVTKALALRLAQVMCKIIPPNQVGFIKSRDIRTNILEAHLVKAFLSDYASPGAMLFVDFVKAYDTLSREFLLEVMHRLGFGPCFLRAIFTLHNFTFAVFVVNNFHTNGVQLFSGVCQGCPLAPLLFALATVPFIDAATFSSLLSLFLPYQSNILMALLQLRLSFETPSMRTTSPSFSLHAQPSNLHQTSLLAMVMHPA